MNPFEEVAGRVDIKELLAGYGCTFSKNGKRLTTCPICNCSDINRPPVQIYNDGSLYCFHCKRRLDVFDLVREMERFESNWEALLFLAKRLGIDVPQGKELKKRSIELDRRASAFRHFAEHFFGCLDESAKKYLNNRSISLDFCEEQLIGYIPQGAGYFIDNDDEMSILRKAGLINSKNEVSYKWQGRLFIPFWKYGKIFYFAGRALDPNNKIPQLLPSNEEMGIEGKLVIGTFRGTSVLLVEGVFDFLTAASAQDGVMAILGQSPVFELPDRAKQVDLCFDWDAAGEDYSLKHGMHFARMGLQVSVCLRPKDLPPEKKDLNDYICSGGCIGDIKKISFLQYLISRVSVDRDKYLPLINEIRIKLGPLQQEELMSALTEATGFKKRSLQNELKMMALADNDSMTHEEVVLFDKNFKTPQGYLVDARGVFIKKKEGLEKICSQIVLVDKLGSDPQEGTVYVSLVFGNNGNLRSQICSRLQIASDNELLKFANFGLEVHSENNRKLTKYLAEFITANEANLEKFTVADQLGWDMYGNFNLPGRSQSQNGITTNVFIDDHFPAGAFEKSGTLEAWIGVVKELKRLKDLSLMVFLLYAGFASVILEKIGGRTFMIHVYGDSSTGKSISLMLPASIVGRPHTRNGLIKRWYSTKNFLGRELEKLKNLPLILDELSVLSNTIVDDIIYTFEGELSKGKASSKNALQNTAQRSWCTVIFSSGEPSLSRAQSLGGIHVRLLEFSGGPFRTEDRDFVDRFRGLLLQNHGHALEVFLNEFFRSRWQDIEFFWDQKTLSRTEGRLSDLFQAVFIAGVLAERAFNFGFNPKEIVQKIFKETLAERSNEGDYTSRFLSFLADYVTRNRSFFKDIIRGTVSSPDEYEDLESESKIKSKLFGYIFKNDQAETAYDLGVTKSDFQSIVKDWGQPVTERMLLKLLKEKGKIVTEKDDNRVRKVINGETKALIYFKDFHKYGEI